MQLDDDNSINRHFVFSPITSVTVRQKLATQTGEGNVSVQKKIVQFQSLLIYE